MSKVPGLPYEFGLHFCIIFSYLCNLLPDICAALFIVWSNRTDFYSQVHFLSSIHHRNLVTLLGYCQENNLQFLIYEYIPNGSVSVHLYGNSLIQSLILFYELHVLG